MGRRVSVVGCRELRRSDMKIQTFRDLDVWNKSIDFVQEIYSITRNFPDDERFGLCSQMRRAAVSIPSNIAEGYRRTSRKEYARFVRIAYGSGSELETQLEIVSRLNFIDQKHFILLEKSLADILRMLNRLAARLECS